MKVRDIFEAGRSRGRGIEEHPFTVDFEHETSAEEGVPSSDMIEVFGNVIVTKDPFSTGDSPTDYEVEIEGATHGELKQPFDLKQLSADDFAWIEDKAILSVTRGL